MYHVSVPITLKACERYGAEKYIDRLREVGAVRTVKAKGQQKRQGG